MRIQTRFDLIPRTYSPYNTINGPVYQPPSGAPNTVSRQQFYFHLGLSKVIQADFLGIWTPNTVNSGIRLYNGTGYIAEVTNVAAIVPVFFGVDITHAVQASVSSRFLENLGIEIKDDGVTAADYYLVGINIIFGDS